MLAEHRVANTFVSSPAIDCRELLTAESELRAAGTVVMEALGDSIDPDVRSSLFKLKINGYSSQWRKTNGRNVVVLGTQ